ncbi:MSH5p Protein of the MutS family [Saccharomyces cerevisiae]|nr:MSH5p Protein of the MutS family [Saccharomyces boulardii (nom. inval.)]
MSHEWLISASETMRSIGNEEGLRDKGAVVANNDGEFNEGETNREEDSSTIFSFDFDEEIVMCIDFSGGKLGCSILDYHTKTLQAFDQDYVVNKTTISSHDLIDDADMSSNDISLLLGLLIMEANPTARTTTNKTFQKMGLIAVIAVKGHDNQTILNDILSNSKFTTTVTLGTVGCILANHEQLGEYNGSTASSNMVTGRLVQNAFEDVIHGIRYIDIRDRMVLDENTISALNIFPTAHKLGHDKMMRNGFFSVFELFNQVSSDYARRILKSWLINPLTNKKRIETRYSIIRTLLDKQNAIIFSDLTQSIKRCPDAFGFINQLRSGKSTLGTWSKVASFLEKGIAIFQLVSSLKLGSDEGNILHDIKNKVDISALKECLRKVETVIDFDTSRDTKTLTINTGVDNRLDECRNIYNHLEGILLDVARETQIFLLNTLPQENCKTTKSLEKLVNAVYIPQLGYLVTISVLMEPLLDGIPNLQWEEIFRSSENIYFKNGRVLELDETYGDIYGAISDFEIEILFSLQEQILRRKTQLTAYNILLSELEILLSFAQVSAERNYAEPQLVEDECILEIINGRHALYETFLDNYIPNSTMIDGGLFSELSWCEQNKGRIIVVTGANASGKSVYLTQNGLIVYLAQIGCFVPAERARIGIADKILTRIRTQETVYKTQSSFLLDSQQMAKSLSLATEKSLILIDEYGKGTDILDGPSLFGSIMLNMSKSEKCPRIIALKEGISKQSFGIYCAKVCGLSRDIVERAEELSRMINRGDDVVQQCGNLTEKEMREFQKNQEIVKKFLSWDLDLETTTTSENLRLKLKNFLR